MRCARRLFHSLDPTPEGVGRDVVDLLTERLLVPLQAELAKRKLAGSAVAVDEAIAERDGSVRLRLKGRA